MLSIDRLVNHIGFFFNKIKKLWNVKQSIKKNLKKKNAHTHTYQSHLFVLHKYSIILFGFFKKNSFKLIFGVKIFQ